jgi:hypothetical protein
MSTLKEFVLERILEDETAAQRAIDAYPRSYRWSISGSAGGAPRYAHEDPWRVLSGCVAKRLIVRAHSVASPTLGVVGRAGTRPPQCCPTCGEGDDQIQSNGPCYTLRVLALHWVDHPDYRNEWRPEWLRPALERL